MKLGSKNQNIFAPPPEEQLQTELKQEAKIGSPISQSNNELVHITIEERLNLELSRDGAPQHSELTGVVLILIQDEQYSKVKFLVDCDDAEHVQIQVCCLSNLYTLTYFW